MFADVVSKALREIITSICRSKVLIRSIGNSLTGKSSRVPDKRDEDHRELDDPKRTPIIISLAFIMATESQESDTNRFEKPAQI